MKISIALLTITLAGCGASSNLTFAPPSHPSGYPVFIIADVGGCAFQVQDMILTGKELSEWMVSIPDKSRQIDIVVNDDGRSCVSRAERLMRAAGFANLALRHSGGANYPSGLPPR